MKFVHAIPSAMACALTMVWGSAHASVGDDKGMDAELPTSLGGMSTTLGGGQLFAKVQAMRPVPTAEAKMPNGESRFDLVVKNASAVQVFMQLGSGTNYNILVPPDLPGTVTVSLKGVTVP